MLKEIEQYAQDHLLDVYLYITVFFKNRSLKQKILLFLGFEGRAGIWEQLQLICMNLALSFSRSCNQGVN